MQVAFAFFMYLNAYPFVVAMRQSSRSALEGGGGDDDDGGAQGTLAPVGRRRQFAAGSRAIASTLAQNDLPWLLLAVVVITIAEDGPLRTTPEPRYLSVLGVIFEVMSAYGTVGLSFSTALSPSDPNYTSIASNPDFMLKIRLRIGVDSLPGQWQRNSILKLKEKFKSLPLAATILQVRLLVQYY